jgi:hypothetical protein
MLPREGDVVDGRIRLDRELPHTAQGLAFDAILLRSGERCIVEVASDLADPTERARYVTDADLAQRLSGTHVVHVLEDGVLDDGTPWSAHERTVSTLAAMIRARGPLPVAEAAAWTLQVCDAVAEAHAQGFAHGDLRPETVALAPSERGDLIAKVTWATAPQVEPLDRAAVRRDIRAIASILRALAAGGLGDDAATTLPSELVQTITRASSDDDAEAYTNVAAFAADVARHAPGGDAFARKVASSLSRAGVVGRPIPKATEGLGDRWFAYEPPPPTTHHRMRQVAFALVAVGLLGVVVGATLALARNNAVLRWMYAPSTVLVTTELTSAETGTRAHAEAVTSRAIVDFSRAKALPLLEASAATPDEQ